jgi:hypothetical protein
LLLVVQAHLLGVVVKFTDLLAELILTKVMVKAALEEAPAVVEVSTAAAIAHLTPDIRVVADLTTAYMVEELVTELADLVEVLVQTAVTLEKVVLLEDFPEATQAVLQVRRDLITAGQTNPMRKIKLEEMVMAM